MRIAITGATGFIGAALFDLLMSRGHEVCALVREASSRERLAAYSVPVFPYASLTDPQLMAQLKLWEPEVMVHLAWKGVSGGERNESFQFVENIPFTLSSVQLAAATGCRQWLGAGSQAEYGLTTGKMSEEDICHPITAYGKAKLAAGVSALGLSDTLGLKGTWCRIYSVYGPGDHSKALIPYLIRSFQNGEMPVLTACEQLWDYLYITDAAAALATLLEQEGAGLFNIGSGRTVVLKEVVETIKLYTGVELPIVYGQKAYAPAQIMHLEANISKLVGYTGWQPVVTLDEGLRRTVQAAQKTILQ